MNRTFVWVFRAGVLVFVATLSLAVYYSVHHRVSAKSLPATPYKVWQISKGYTRQNRELPGVLMAYVGSENGSDNGFGLSLGSDLSVRCENRFWGVYVDTHVPVALKAGSSNAPITYVLDGDRRVTKSAKASTETVLYIGGIELVLDLLKTSRFTVHYSTYEDKPATVYFDVRGFSDVLAALSSACPLPAELRAE